MTSTTRENRFRTNSGRSSSTRRLPSYAAIPYVSDPRFVTLDEALERSDVLILGAPHSDYRSLVIPDDKPVIDVWNFFGKGAQLT